MRTDEKREVLGAQASNIVINQVVVYEKTTALSLQTNMISFFFVCPNFNVCLTSLAKFFRFIIQIQYHSFRYAFIH